MNRNILAGLLTVAGIGVLASCSERQAPAGPGIGFNAEFGEEDHHSLGHEGMPPGPVNNGDFVCVGGETVLLIQDVVPWFLTVPEGDQGAAVTELVAQGKNFCRITSSEIGTTDLQAFLEILIAGDQNQGFYDNLFPSSTVHPAISDFVWNGGILSAHLTDFGQNMGNWTWATFVGDVAHVFFGSNFGDIADPSHPVIANALPCPSGNCGEIFDGPDFLDLLDGWTFDSHGFFTNLPEGTQVILVDEQGGPVMVEYQYGLGTVIATLVTLEWRYQGGPIGMPETRLLANEIAYQDCLAGHEPHLCRAQEPVAF